MTATLTEMQEELARATEALANYDIGLNYILDAQISRYTSEYEREHGRKADIEANIARLTALLAKAETAGAVKAPVEEAITEEAIIP